MQDDTFYSLTASHVPGKTYSFDLLKGKVVLIVNVASLCGFTPQYNELQALYQKYQGKGLEILAFPCNQFGSQEPYDNAHIQKYVQSHFNVSFPILSKVLVNGRGEDPIYRHLKLKKAGALGFCGVRWNFEKFLVDRNGDVVARFDTVTPPKTLEPMIVRLLAA
ncbi:hypothetical protein METBIDRAFT_36748 [Metschnikowia bicuspidata var. bicuspidata NRRL YB-4993]|uniref:Glutathione peroxidase n=1 Tax=Metschnikowia bicuspidata var. bicuspidata NRRL YB-4993 TaxID=869754 RepID=A0A1A0HKQ8_9ASCO|nr:hypothetical protein METBIDRAFT_36748 [Metschnikowia bicuspidata var. bicuspidata NRRL YB-4993]OBA24477.1 hypothetical protein METBIDRAFT_36748 [Metschnikowia bicuspidata var. bicuspidata NRRL YB-4993]